MSDLLNGKHYCRTDTPDANGLRSECGSPNVQCESCRNKGLDDEIKKLKQELRELKCVNSVYSRQDSRTDEMYATIIASKNQEIKDLEDMLEMKPWIIAFWVIGVILLSFISFKVGVRFCELGLI